MTDLVAKAGIGADRRGPGSEGPPTVGRRLVSWLGRVPFTVTVILVILVLGVVTGTLWEPLGSRSWYGQVGYGLPALQVGRLHTLVLGPFFAAAPVYYLPLIAGFGVVVGFAEWRLGTGRTIAVTLAGQVVGVLGGALLLLLFRSSGWVWAHDLAAETHVGFAAGIASVLAVASATVPPPWRLRLRLGMWVWLLVAVLYLGRLADLEAFAAVAIAMPLSRRLAGSRAQVLRAQPTRREWRLLATAGLIIVLAIQLVAWWFPTVGPIGSTENVAATGWWLAGLLVVGVLLLNGLRRGRRVAWWFAVVLASLEPLLLLFVIFVVVFAPVFGWEYRLSDVPQFTTEAMLWTALLVVLIVGRRAFRVPRRRRRRQLIQGRSAPDAAKEILRRNGGGSLSWMTTWPENSHLISDDESSYIAFRRHAGLAVAIGDPVGPPGSGPAVLGQFVRFCDNAGLVPCLFSVTRTTALQARRIGWQSVQVAQDNLIDLPGLEFKGKSWQDVRTATNRAAKEGIEFRLVMLADEKWSVVHQLEEISQEWLGDKGLPEMGFTLGGVTEALDREVRVGLAVDGAGRIHGVTSWMPVYGAEGSIVGWTLDLMRRREDGFRSAMEFLIASSCSAFRDQGAAFVSLSGAPLARSGAATSDSAIDRLLESLGATLEPVYGFRSLLAFKNKFRPRHEPMYLAFRDEADLPRIGIGLTRAYLPTTPVTELLTLTRRH
jgi:lysylphosphatidylglycerol synthetase-like protein (DUF2156 family)